MNLVATIKGKKVALLCTGASLNSDIDLKEYDVVVGVNRIYLTSFANQIDILFHNASQLDNNPKEVLEILLKKNPNTYTFFIPSVKKSPIHYLMYLDRLALEGYAASNLCASRDSFEQRWGWQPLSGLMALDIILNLRPKSLGIYGMDFYQVNSDKKYCQDLMQFPNMTLDHDMKSNYIYFTNVTGCKIPKLHRHRYALGCKNVEWHIDQEIIENLQDVYS